MTAWKHRVRADPDRGAYAVMYAVLTTALIGVVSIVIDLAALRLDRRVDRAAVDAAAIAGAAQLGEEGANPVGACRRALDYIAVNLGADRPSDSCGDFLGGGSTLCDATTPSRTVDATVDGRTVQITWPVPDDHPLITDADVEGSADLDEIAVTDSDGTACQRLGIRITNPRDFAFAGIFGGTGATTTSHSVGLARLSSTGDIPAPLVTLSEGACDALVVSEGEAEVAASPSDPVQAEIAIDSDAAGCAPDSVVEVGDGRLTSDRISVFRLDEGTWPPPRVTAEPFSRGWRVTSTPWRDRYDCGSSPTVCGLPSTVGEPADYLDQWIDYAESLSTQVSSFPDPPDTTGWDTLTLAECQLVTDVPADVLADCDDPLTPAEEELVVSDGVTFGGKLVANTAVEVTGDAEFTGDVFVGSEDDPRPMTIDVGTVSFAAAVAITSQLTIANGATVSFAAPPDPDARDVVGALTVDAATITSAYPLNIRGDISLLDGASVTAEESVRVRDDLRVVTSTIIANDMLSVNDDISVVGNGRLTARQLVRTGDDLGIEGTSIARLEGRLVVRGALVLNDSACVLITTDISLATCADTPSATGSDHESVYLGALAVTEGATLVGDKAFVFVNGRVNLSSSGSTRLVAPHGGSDCQAMGLPPTPACFEDLAMWTDGDDEHTLRLQVDDAIDGTVVTPTEDSSLELRWDGDLNLNHAQFVAQRLIFNADDSADTLTMRPDPERTTLIPQSAGTLIR